MSEQPQTTLEGADLASVIEGYASDVKAIDVVELDLRGVLGYTDYFVICSGNSDRQAKAIHDGIHLGMKKDHGMLPRRVREALGSRRIRAKSSRVRSCSSTRIGNRPCSSGIRSAGFDTWNAPAAMNRM